MGLILPAEEVGKILSKQRPVFVIYIQRMLLSDIETGTGNWDPMSSSACNGPFEKIYC